MSTFELDLIQAHKISDYEHLIELYHIQWQVSQRTPLVDWDYKIKVLPLSRLLVEKHSSIFVLYLYIYIGNWWFVFVYFFIFRDGFLQIIIPKVWSSVILIIAELAMF